MFSVLVENGTITEGNRFKVTAALKMDTIYKLSLRQI